MDTIGTIGVPDSRPKANISLENPAPATTRSIPSSMAVFTRPKNSVAATIAFIPIMPVGDNFLANCISYRNSSKGMPDAAIRPIPPSFATAAANRAVDNRIAIPP